MNRFKMALVFLLVVGLAFLIGFGWQFLRARRAADALSQTAEQLSLQRLENTLAAATIEAQRGDYETARRLASEFYTGLQARVNQSPSADSTGFHAILGQRDETITLLSRSDTQSGESLARQFVRFRQTVSGAAGTLPLGQVRTRAPAAPASSTPPAATPTPAAPTPRPAPAGSTRADSVRADTGGPAGTRPAVH